MRNEPKSRSRKHIAVAVVALALLASGAYAQTSRVFVTSTRYTGDLGGLAGADAKCQAHADAAALGSTWVAWLSDSSTDAVSRLTATGPFERATGPAAVIATSIADLTDGDIAAPIQHDESGAFVGTNHFSHTGTDVAGLRHSNGQTFCDDWTSTSAGAAIQGTNQSATSTWTVAGFHACDGTGNWGGIYHLYCFEQGMAPAPVPSITTSGLPALAILFLAGLAYLYRRQQAA